MRDEEPFHEEGLTPEETRQLLGEWQRELFGASMYYELDKEHNPVPITMEESTGLWDPDKFEEKRRVAQTTIGKTRVSTVFLVINHAFDFDGAPVLFETMVFSDELPRLNELQERYCTWADAKAGHARWVKRVKAAYARKRRKAK